MHSVDEHSLNFNEFSNWWTSFVAQTSKLQIVLVKIVAGYLCWFLRMDIIKATPTLVVELSLIHI